MSVVRWSASIVIALGTWVGVSWGFGYLIDYTMFERLVLVGLVYLAHMVTFWGYTNAKLAENLEDLIQELDTRVEEIEHER